MAIGKEIETRGHIIGFREEIAKSARNSEDVFFTWFDAAKNKDAAFVRGGWDFMVHIAQPAGPFLENPEEKKALEIGYGGGRLLAAASRLFREAIGVDIHENSEMVSNELTSRGIENATLFRTEGSDIPVSDSSVDLVYSFIVLQHVERMEVFEKYMKETYRVLKPNGVAVLYFGRRYALSYDTNSRLLYLLDRFMERILLPFGFKEFPARVNCTNLMVSLPHAKKLAREIGFKVLRDLVSHKHVPNGLSKFGGQNGIVIKKPQ